MVFGVIICFKRNNTVFLHDCFTKAKHLTHDMNTEQGYLLFVPSGGLGNRLRALASAVWLTRATGTQLQTIWFQDWALHAPFHTLFEDNSQLCLREASWRDLLVYDRPRKRNLFVPKWFQNRLFSQRIEEYEVTPLKKRGFDFVQWVKGKRSYMSCYQDFGEVPNALYAELFHPIAALEQRIEENLQKVGPHPIGIHIRRTDNQASIALSPIQLFIDRAEEILKEHPDQRFYLATDDEPTKLAFKQRFGEHIITASNKAERGNTAGIQDAVVEMFTLARMEEIYGTADSSFSVIASRIGNNRLTILQQ